MGITHLVKKSALRKEIIEDIDSLDSHKTTKDEIFDFVDYCLKRYRFLEDAFELSILLEYNTEQHYLTGLKIMEKRNSYSLKLSVLDFTLMVSGKKKFGIYFKKINDLGLVNKNVFVSFQGRLNLLCFENKNLDFFLDSCNYPIPSLHYRFINSVEFSGKLMCLFLPYKTQIIDGLNQSEILSKGQKDELYRRVNKWN